MRGAVAAQDLWRVIVGIETDAQQMRLLVKVGLLLQLLIDEGKVAAHQSALIWIRATRVDESQQQRLAAIVMQADRLSVLIKQREVRYFITGLCFHWPTDVGISRVGTFPGHKNVLNP